MPQAQEGDQEAQTYVGEIYEKGLGVTPDYATASAWYRKAAAQGQTRAQINLGHLYEKGLGVPRDLAQALQWYRQASGLREGIALDTGSIPFAGPPAERSPVGPPLQPPAEQAQREAAALQQQLERTQQQLVRTQHDAEQRQREAEHARQQVAQMRQELEHRQHAARDEAALQRLSTQLQQREAALTQQQQEMARLQQEVTSLREETTRQRTQLTALSTPQPQVTQAGPSIELIDPPVIGGSTRGLVIARVTVSSPGQPRDIIGRVTSPAGLFALMVNDRTVPTDARGMFRTPVLAHGPQTPVTIVAVDTQGKRASMTFELTSDSNVTAPGASSASVRAPAFGTYHALIIGNKTYNHWTSLTTPEQDAAQAAAILRQRYGFQTRVLLNATRFAILQALNDLRKQLTENDNLLLYYAGHGHWDKQIQRGYWIPVDGHTDSDVNWISTLAITDMLSAIAARHVLVVSDSCYAGALTRSSLARLESGMSAEAREHWLKAIAEKRSRTVLASGGLQPVLDAGGGQHSVFAKAFLDILAKNAEILEGQRLGLEVAARVAYAASAALIEQEPQYAPMRYAGHEAGDFLFVPTTR